MDQIGRRHGVMLVVAAAAVSSLTVNPAVVSAQDQTVQELVRKVDAEERDNGFCSSVPWYTTNPQAERRFLENAQIGTAEAARFPSGECSYTYVTNVYEGSYGKCVRYTWWACGPTTTCGKGESLYCKNEGGGFSRQKI
jgi:hypothetical protein